MANEVVIPSPQTLVPVAPEGLGARLSALPAKPMLLLGVGAAALAAVAIALVINGSKGDYKVLFANLSDKDGGAIIAQLSQMNVPYRHAEGGAAILVPADKVYDLRMKLGQAGLPKNANGSGYELLDAQTFGQTQQRENVAIKRAIEGELARTIGSLNAVESARVMLGLPPQNGFFREEQKPTASVNVILRAGRTLDRAQIAGIVHLVSAAVPNLEAKAVKLTDGNGSLLSQADSNGEGLDAQQLQYVQQVEQNYQRNVMALLEPVLGREQLRATVTAEVDFSETIVNQEEHKPNQMPDAAAVKSTTLSESTQPGSATPSGVPGAQSNQPPKAASAPTTGAAQPLQAAQGGAGGANARRESSTQYAVDRTERTTRAAVGTVKRLSAAVVVNDHVSVDPKGKTVTKPLTNEEIEKLTTLVQQAIGFNKDRGDTVRVINSTFRAEPTAAPTEVPLWQQPWLQDLLRAAAAPAALAFVALLIVMTTIRPALKTLFAPPPAPEPGSQVDAVVDDLNQLPDGTTAQTLALEAPKVNEKLVSARALAKENPAAMANMVRTMINGEANA